MNCSRGFSLIEVMVSLAIATIGLTALGSFSISSINGAQIGRERMTASHIAEQVMEVWQFSAVDQFPDVDGACDPTLSTSVKTLPYSIICRSLFGEKIKYVITGDQSIAGGPNRWGTGPFVGFSQGTYTNAPWVKSVTVVWWNDGNPHSIVLSHLTAVN